MKTIAIFTTTRAEFGILTPLLEAIHGDSQLESRLFVGGAHLAEGFGDTLNEIKATGFEIADTFDYLQGGDDGPALARGLAKATGELARIFEQQEFDFVCVVGDRYELLAVMGNAILFQKAIIHLHGGERTEGAIDEQVRHMITKAAHLHFVACEEYAENVRRLGEPAWRVHNTGALAVDSMVRNEPVPRGELFTRLGLEDVPTVLLTYHPVTLGEALSPVHQMQKIFEALGSLDLQVVVTAPNLDRGRGEVVEAINRESIKNAKVHYHQSLGAALYHSLIPHCALVIGNSSSGLLEVPYFRIPTVNIGDRQKGRIRHASVIDTGYDVADIADGAREALSDVFQSGLKGMSYKFGDGHAAEKMVAVIKDTKIDRRLLRKTLEFSGV